MASIYSKSASSRLAGPRRSLRQPKAGLQGPVEVFASPKQACMASSKSSPAQSRLAWPRRSLRQRQVGLRGPVEVFASPKQACMALSKSSPASNGHGSRIPRGDWGGGQLWGREEGLGAGIYLCPRFRPKKKQIYEQFDLPIPESGK